MKMKNKVSMWLNAANPFFSKIGGEKFKNSEVILAFLGTVAMIGGCLAGEWIENL
jgi:hypothetical protein